MPRERSWTIYIAQDKHLDYDWCGAETEIEPRMAALVDGYLDLVEAGRARWNLDCALWLEVYRRQRGEAGAARLLGAIRQGWVGYGAQVNVALWGLMGPDLAARALAAGREIEQATGRAAHTALIMENAGMSWGVAQALADGGVRYVARGVYDLRAESYIAQRAPYPLYWWVAPDGRRLLTHWPLYDSTRTWGGYAEASELLRLAGEDWDAFHLQRAGDRNTPEVYAARVAYIQATAARYEALGDAYPASSIMLLGTGWDNWTITDDVSRFIERYNAEESDRIRLVDARYDEFFAAVEREVAERGLTLPEQRGSYGACWEEWGAHLAGAHAEFRRAERLLPQIEAGLALAAHPGSEPQSPLYAAADRSMEAAYRALLRYVEHDMGGCDLASAAIAAGNRAAAATRALTIAQTLAPAAGVDPAPRPPLQATYSSPARRSEDAALIELPWRGGAVALDPLRCAVVSLRDGGGTEWAPPQAQSGEGAGLGELLRTRYRGQGPWGEGPFREVLPEALPGDPHALLADVRQREGPGGSEVLLQGRRWGLDYTAMWLFDRYDDDITLTYHLRGDWGTAPQSLQVACPLALGEARYHYDSVGAIIAAGRPDEGGEELPGANPILRALHTFAAAHEAPAAGALGATLLSPDAHLVLFGPAASRAVGPLEAGIVSMPMMNLTRNDRQVTQGGRNEWVFRYRLILERRPFDPLRALRAAQRFAPPFLWIAGVEPVAPGLAAFEIAYDGGPLLSCRRAQPDGLLLRFWNATDRPAEGALRLPDPYRAAERCDALGRPLGPLPVEGGRAHFVAPARGFATVGARR